MQYSHTQTESRPDSQPSSRLIRHLPAALAVLLIAVGLESHHLGLALLAIAAGLAFQYRLSRGASPVASTGIRDGAVHTDGGSVTVPTAPRRNPRGGRPAVLDGGSLEHHRPAPHRGTPAQSLGERA